MPSKIFIFIREDNISWILGIAVCKGLFTLTLSRRMMTIGWPACIRVLSCPREAFFPIQRQHELMGQRFVDCDRMRVRRHVSIFYISIGCLCIFLKNRGTTRKNDVTILLYLNLKSQGICQNQTFPTTNACGITLLACPSAHRMLAVLLCWLNPGPKLFESIYLK